MAAHILRNVRLFTGGADLTGVSNKVGMDVTVAEKDVTTFGSYDAATDSIWREVLGGLKSGDVEADGFWEAGDDSKVDDASWAGLGGSTSWTICPHTAAVGQLAYLTAAHRGSYSLGDAVGEVAPWKASAQSTWPITRGVVLHPPGTARTADGAGTAVEHVAVPAGAYLYATLHVLSVAGTSTPTITVKVESDVDDTFAAPADVLTFDAATDLGGQTARAAGPITDTYYRVSHTITGSDPSFLYVVAIGVG